MNKELSADTNLSHYRVISKIGAGGMGEVYLARDTKLDRRVALKILPTEFAADKNRMSRFIREAKSASALNHPNIITIYEIGETDDIHFIAAEFIEGETLHSHQQKQTLSFVSALDIAIQIASALDTAHQAGIIHRDIKPENVMIRPDGLVKILDFGIAKLSEISNGSEVDEAAETAIKTAGTNPGVLIGTANYMSPEQARGKTVDARSDVFSFGIVLYEMLSRKRAFAGETMMDTISAILHKEPLQLNLILPELPLEIERIVNKTLRKKLNERYQSIAEVLADLRRVKQKLDYEEIERSFSTEDTKSKITQQNTAVSTNHLTESNKTAAITSPETLPPNNLSVELSLLIGRETELEEVENLLKKPDIRLLTITGVGGTGKTRLAQAIAHDALAEFTDGVYFINLSATENPELVAPIIAQTLGIREEGSKPLKERLKDYLRELKMLVVLDNFEQITEAAPTVGELLADSINLKILVTSRVRLYLRFEQEFPLSPLTVPVDKSLTANELGKYPAVALFIERAQAVKPSFTLTTENAASIAEICRRLDGLPLAIELAAARVKMFAPKAILTRLSNSLKLLSGGAVDLPERQQTIRGAIAWSYDLLDAEERKSLDRLAVFAGGFTLEGAEAIANAEAGLSIDILDGISSLVDKSLLAQREQSDGEPRFRMLTVVREFALEKLAESGEADDIKRRHTTFYTVLSGNATPKLRGAKAAEWFEKLEEEHENLRSALEWSLDNEPETALRIAASINYFWVRHGYLAEGYKWTYQALEKSGEDADTGLRAEALRCIGILSWQQGDLETANAFYEKSLRLSREIGDKKMISHSLGGLGVIKAGRGEFQPARMLSEESLAIAREIKYQPQITLMLNNLGEVARGEADYQAARKYYEEAMALAKQDSHSNFVRVYAVNLAFVTYLSEDYQSSRSYCLESLELSDEMGDKMIIGLAIDGLAALAVKAGEYVKAARMTGAAQSVHEAIGYKIDKVDREFIDRYVNEAREAVGGEMFDAAYTEGRAMSLEEAVLLAKQV